ncbi:MAG: 50S ribosomal protein L1 [Verrucomicrobiales bacterium]
MPTKRSKRYQQAVKLLEAGRRYSLEEAAELVKKFPGPKFDQTVTLSFKMGVDPKKSDQAIRSTCPLPHGSGKKVRVLVFAKGAAADAAREAGAELVGLEDMVKKVTEGFFDFDVAVATPDAMAEVRKLGKQLGPRGLMPNPKTGTVTDDTAKAVREVKAGRVDFRLDRNGNIAASIGKVSFSSQQLAENGNALIDSVIRAKPPTAKGKYIESITLAATMTPGVLVDEAKFLKITA